MIGLPLCAVAKSPKTLEDKGTMISRNVGHRIKRHSGTPKRGATLLHVTPGTSASTETENVRWTQKSQVGQSYLVKTPLARDRGGW